MTDFRKLERFFIIFIFAASLFFITLLVLAKYPRWWEYVIFERTPMTWFESILLFSCFITAAACAGANYLLKEKKKLIVWSVISSGFLCLTLDERFAIHERLRDKLLAPADIDIPIFFWTSPGDYLLIILFIVSAFMFPLIIRMIKARKGALLFFIAAISFTGIAILLDSFDVHNCSMPFQRAEQFVEEILETLGMLSFLSTFFLMLITYMEKMTVKLNKSSL